MLLRTKALQKLLVTVSLPASTEGRRQNLAAQDEGMPGQRYRIRWEAQQGRVNTHFRTDHCCLT